MNSFSKFILTGLAGGFISAGFGLGGGVVMLPLLLMLLHIPIRKAVPMSLAAIIPITALSFTLHWLSAGHVFDLQLFLAVSLTAVIGSRAGVWISSKVSVAMLSWMFSFLLLYTFLRMSDLLPSAAPAISADPGIILSVLIGLVAGISAALFGVGGGIIMVPAFTLLGGMNIHNAVFHSLSIIIPTTSASLFFHYRHNPHFPALRDLTGLLTGGAFGAVAGVLFSYNVGTAGLRGSFSILLFLVWFRYVWTLMRSRSKS